jgi:predicted phage-related endonuclease
MQPMIVVLDAEMKKREDEITNDIQNRARQMNQLRTEIQTLQREYAALQQKATRRPESFRIEWIPEPTDERSPIIVPN